MTRLVSLLLLFSVVLSINSLTFAEEVETAKEEWHYPHHAPPNEEDNHTSNDTHSAHVASHHIDHETGTHHIHVDHDEDYGQLTHLKTAFPDICKKVENEWYKMIQEKHNRHLELVLFNTAGILAQDLDNALEQHKKEDHEHFTCHEAKELLSKSSARETLDLFRLVLQNPVEGHTGETVEVALKEMKKMLNEAELLSEDSSNEIEDILQDLMKMHRQYDVIKKDYDAVMSEHEDCRKNFASFIKETLDVTHDDIPKYEHLEMGLGMLREQCNAPQEL